LRPEACSGRILASLPRSILHELWFSTLWEGELDQVEGARGDSGLEYLASLLQHFADVIARRNMDQGQELDFGLAGYSGGLADGGVAGVGGALGLLLGEAGVVDEQLPSLAGLTRRPAGSRVAGDDDRAAGARLAHHRAGLDRPLGAVNPLAPLQRREVGAFLHAELLRGLRVEASRTLPLDQRVADGAHAVLDREGAHLGAVAGDRIAGLQFDQVELVADPADHPAETLDQVTQAARPINRQRPLS